jgi:hypothetical protein
MNAKHSAARRAAFLRALAQTGNVTLAAERAKVSRSWVQLHRGGDPAFRRLCDETVDEAKAALRQAQDKRGGGVRTAFGLTPASAYNHRRRWPAFAERWDAAVEEGYVRLETGLIHAAGNLFSDEEPPDALYEPGPVTAITADHAIHLLHMHKHQVHGIGKRPGLRAREPDIEEVRAEILRKVAAMERARGRSEAERARDREEWALRRGDRGTDRE